MRWQCKSKNSSPASSRQVSAMTGFGGSGKTTLANQVYQKAGRLFNCQAFVSVSQNPDIRKILRSMLSQIRKEDFPISRSSDEAWLINSMRDFLKDKRYLIVIDDIWSIQAWKTIKCALLENSCGSRIIVTTRNVSVAKSCCFPRLDLAYELRPLTEADSKILFFTRVFGSVEKCPLHLNEISTEIIKKCGGLPLAIITIGSLLTTKSDSREDWVRVRNSIGRGLEKNPHVEEMERILSLSYNDLTLQLKTCLLYLSMYPEDYEVQMEDLVRRWIAERFVKVDGGKNLFDTGKGYFYELINRNMIQPTYINYDGQAMACRVHDMIRDLIISKALEENFITSSGHQTHSLVAQHKVRRLSIDYRGLENVKTVSSMVTAHVRTLGVFGCTGQVPPLSEFPALRMLALDRSEKLEIGYLKNITKLCLLRYLRIEGSCITELPEQIGDLQCLEMLDLHGTGIRELPTSIVQLLQLKLLLVDGAKLPHGIGNMQGIEELSCITVDDSTSINLLQELGGLTRMRILGLKLCMSAHKTSTRYVDKLVSSLGKLGSSQLERLSVKTDGRLIGIPFGSWSPPPRLLQELITSDLCLCQIPDWMASMASLTCLQIGVNRVTQETLLVLGGLPVLLSLTLNSSQNAEPKQRLVVSNNMFRCLKRFLLYCEVGLLTFEAGAMPKLKALEFQIVALEAKSACIAPDLGISNLCALSDLCLWIDCQGEKAEEGVHELESVIRIAASLLPNRPTPYFHRLY
ncbi:disease resistance protein RGA5 isoform X2 [Aegilops tauschii subsp. strangulata]|nr:disease resistance protein RGA5 isoform X2 [Aegilops tauschii subsp. strangulata]